FNNRVTKSKPGEVIFYKGQLVQVYRSDLDYTFKTECKLLPKWSQPRTIVEKNANSYKLEMLDGKPISRNFSAWWLRPFSPRAGTQLEKEQEEVERKRSEVRCQDATTLSI
ncbi:hypothetical protein AMATHDRAFT_157940, partial [Amanita thiersii Skay4041]